MSLSRYKFLKIFQTKLKKYIWLKEWSNQTDVEFLKYFIVISNNIYDFKNKSKNMRVDYQLAVKINRGALIEQVQGLSVSVEYCR